MIYTKPPLTFSQQADLLIQRGLEAGKQELIEKLEAVNYYRLSGYWYPFKNPDDTFKPNTTLETIWKRYTFDRQLRLIVLDAIERVEVSVRTQIVYTHSHNYGAFGYTNRATIPNLDIKDFGLLQDQLISNTNKSCREEFIKHFFNKYGDSHSRIPLWTLAEIMNFGTMLTFFRGLQRKDKKAIALKYNLKFGVLESWLQSLNIIRNICAHHGRLWNYALGIKPLVPQKDSQWHTPIAIPNDRIFAILTILKYMMNIIAPQSKWSKRLVNLINDYPEIPIQPMGFPENWNDCPIWALPEHSKHYEL